MHRRTGPDFILSEAMEYADEARSVFLFDPFCFLARRFRSQGRPELRALKEDRDFVLKVVAIDGSALLHAPKFWKMLESSLSWWRTMMCSSLWRSSSRWRGSTHDDEDSSEVAGEGIGSGTSG